MSADVDVIEAVRGSGVDPETVEAVMTAMRRFGPNVWAATTWEGLRLLGNGLGDTGRGKTWAEALESLTAKHRAREARALAIEAERLNARDRLRRALAWGSLALGLGLAIWWAWR